MRKNYIQNKVATSSILLPVATVITISSWYCSNESWQTILIHGVLTMFCAYLLILLDTTYSLIRTRSRMSSAFFLYCMAGIPLVTVFPIEIGMATSFLVSLYMLLSTFQEDKKTLPMRSFLTYLFLSISVLIHPVTIILLIPYVIVMGSYLRAWTLRSSTAALLGLCAPFWFLLGWYLLTWDRSLPDRFIEQLQTLFVPYQDAYMAFNPEDSIRPLMITIISICSISHYFRTRSYDKMHTRMLLNSLVLIETFLILVTWLLPQFIAQTQTLLICITSILAGHYFALDNSKTTRIIFIFTVISLSYLIIQNLWNNFSLSFQTH